MKLNNVTDPKELLEFIDSKKDLYKGDVFICQFVI